MRDIVVTGTLGKPARLRGQGSHALADFNAHFGAPEKLPYFARQKWPTPPGRPSTRFWRFQVGNSVLPPRQASGC